MAMLYLQKHVDTYEHERSRRTLSGIDSVAEEVGLSNYRNAPQSLLQLQSTRRVDQCDAVVECTSSPSGDYTYCSATTFPPGKYDQSLLDEMSAAMRHSYRLAGRNGGRKVSNSMVWQSSSGVDIAVEENTAYRGDTVTATVKTDIGVGCGYTTVHEWTVRTPPSTNMVPAEIQWPNSPSDDATVNAKSVDMMNLRGYSLENAPNPCITPSRQSFC